MKPTLRSLRLIIKITISAKKFLISINSRFLNHKFVCYSKLISRSPILQYNNYIRRNSFRLVTKQIFPSYMSVITESNSMIFR